MIAKEGWLYVGIGVAVALAGAFVGRRVCPCGWPVAVLGALLAVFSLYFFRDPERPLPSDPALLYSTGDGRVLSVAEEEPGRGTVIRTFLSVFNVHVQRYPCGGRVLETRIVPGSFRAAMKAEAAANARSVVRLAVADRSEEVVFEQITGLIARRIVCRAREGDLAVAGERYGLIHFGSQVALRLPPSAKPLVSVGDKVVGGVTPVARWTKTD